MTENEKKALGFGALGLLGGALDYFGAQRQIAGAEQDVESAEVNLSSSLDNLGENQYVKSLDQANLEAMMTGFRPTDLTPLQTAQAQNLEALATGGERALMTGATDLARQSIAAQQTVQDRDFSRELMGREAAAKSTAEIDAANAAARQQANLLQTQIDQQNLIQAQQNLAQIEADKASAIPKALASTLALASAFAGTGKEGGKVDEISNYSIGGMIAAPLVDSFLGSVGTNAGDALMDAILIDKKNPPPPSTAPNEMEMGGKPIVQKLDGPEDHDKKKFAIMESGAVIDEDNGEKVAEATGQEYILNSKQAKGIHDEYDTITEKIKSDKDLTQEDWMAFYKAVDAVFSLPQFNEEIA